MATYIIVFIGTLLISLTIYSIREGFGNPSKDLRDPFEDS